MDEKNSIVDAAERALAWLKGRLTWLGGQLATFAGQVTMRGLVLGVVGLLVILALLLPPISLLRRLGIVGYETLNAANASVSHPDGIALKVDGESFPDRLRVRLGSVPRLEFLEGSAGRRLKKAAGALP
ncbi:MAG: hypothetical protein PVG25_03515, partial [Anaerolineae bacterium]